MMKQKSMFAFKTYHIIIWISLAIFSGIFIFYFINSFFTHQQTRVNESMITDVSWATDKYKVRQTRVFDGKAYHLKYELILKNVNLKINSFSDLPISLLSKDKKTVRATYYNDFNIAVVPIAENQLNQLKMSFGLIKCFYLLMIIFVIWQVKVMLVSLKRNTFFENKIVGKSIMWIGLICAIFPIVNLIVNYLMKDYLIKLVEFERLKFIDHYDFSILLWHIGGILCMIIGAMILNGVNIKEEQDLTI